MIKINLISEAPTAAVAKKKRPEFSLGAKQGDIILITNAALRDVIPEPYLTTARSKGLRERTVLTRHALRNAMLPLVARIGLMAGLMFGGSTLIESVFSYPGIGLMVYNAVIARDFPLLQGGLLVIVLALLFLGLLLFPAGAYPHDLVQDVAGLAHLFGALGGFLHDGLSLSG